MNQAAKIKNIANEVVLTGEISDSWGVSLETVKASLPSTPTNEITIAINSPGGSVTEGLAIAAFLKAYPAKIKTNIIGLAASIATPVALAGDEVYIDKDSFFMIHNPWALAAGESDDLRQTADVLDKMKEGLLDIYLDRIKKSNKLINNRIDSTKNQILQWMNNETWFTAQEAFEAGFVDGITDRMKKDEDKETAEAILNRCKEFKNVPTAFLNKVKNIVEMSNNQETTKKEEAKEPSFWDKFVALFNSKPKEVKALINELEVQEEKEEQNELAKALELVKAKGFQVIEVAEEEVQVEETIEEPQQEVQEESSEMAELKAKLAEVQAKQEEAEKKLQLIEEQKKGAPSAGDGGNAKKNNKSNSQKIAPTAAHKEALKSVGKLFN